MQQITIDDFLKNNNASSFGNLIGKIYGKIRYPETPYPDHPKEPLNIDEKTAIPSEHIRKVYNEGGWHHRFPKGFKGTANPDKSKRKCIGRISLNTYRSNGLIDELDSFTKGKDLCYKTPNNSNDWKERHDPVTIYFFEGSPITDEIKKEIQALSAPYIREGGKLPGNEYSPGVAIDENPGEPEIRKLIEQTKNISPSLTSAISGLAIKDDRVSLSSGQYRACLEAMNLYKSANVNKTSDILNNLINNQAKYISLYDRLEIHTKTDKGITMYLSQKDYDKACKKLTDKGLDPNEDIALAKRTILTEDEFKQRHNAYLNKIVALDRKIHYEITGSPEISEKDLVERIKSVPGIKGHNASLKTDYLIVPIDSLGKIENMGKDAPNCLSIYSAYSQLGLNPEIKTSKNNGACISITGRENILKLEKLIKKDSTNSSVPIQLKKNQGR